jgi:hypothetical protein
MFVRHGCGNRANRGCDQTHVHCNVFKGVLLKHLELVVLPEQCARNLRARAHPEFELANGPWFHHLHRFTTGTCTSPKSCPGHGGTIPGHDRIYMSSQKCMAPSAKAWRTLATAHCPCIWHGFIVFTCCCTLIIMVVALLCMTNSTPDSKNLQHTINSMPDAPKNRKNLNSILDAIIVLVYE